MSDGLLGERFISLEPEPLCGTAKAPEGWRCTRQLGHPGPCAGVLDIGFDSVGAQADERRWSFGEGVTVGFLLGAMCVIVAVALSLGV